jgi:hypothetical protein
VGEGSSLVLLELLFDLVTPMLGAFGTILLAFAISMLGLLWRARRIAS